VQSVMVAAATHALLHHADEVWAWRTFFPLLLALCNHTGSSAIRVAAQVGVHEAITMRDKGLRFTHPEILVCESLRAIYYFLDKYPDNVEWGVKYREVLLIDATTSTTLRDIYCVQRKEINFLLLDTVVPPKSFGRLTSVLEDLQSTLGSHGPFEMHRVRQLCNMMNTNGVLASIAPEEFSGKREKCFVTVPTEEHDNAIALDAEAGGEDPASALPEVEVSDSAFNIQGSMKDETSSSAPRKHHPAVVVASFIRDKIKLAALCRTCEIFGVEALVVSSMRMLQSAACAATSRASHQWLPVVEAPREEVGRFLSGKRKEGYQVVAVDRAPTGMDLAECVLPRRCVFVLRGEDDLPMAILQQCDECVEVCRLGRVIHLEVHVNCALVMHEYVRQHFC